MAGGAVLYLRDGAIVVESADPIIWVATAVLREMRPTVLSDGGELVLDTAQQYRYRFHRLVTPDTAEFVRIFEESP